MKILILSVCLCLLGCATGNRAYLKKGTIVRHCDRPLYTITKDIYYFQGKFMKPFEGVPEFERDLCPFCGETYRDDVKTFRK